MKQVYLYIVKRILLYILIFFLALTTFFFVLHIAPGDPLLRYVRQMESMYGYATGTTLEGVAKFREQFGLDEGFGKRYLAFMNQLFLHGNFGPSIVSYPVAAQHLIYKALPWTIGLLGVSVGFSWIIGMILGTFMGWKRSSIFEKITKPMGLVFSQVPIYLMALMLAMVFVYGIAVFPSGGAYSPMIRKAFSFRFIASVIRHATLPALSQIAVGMFMWGLTQRALVINLLGEDYMRLGEAKGLSNGRLAYRYVLRNTLLPQATGLALSLGFVVNGFFLIEWIFRYPGIGRLFIESISSMDYNVLLGITAISMITVLLANLIIELLYPLIDPRIRRGQT